VYGVIPIATNHIEFLKLLAQNFGDSTLIDAVNIHAPRISQLFQEFTEHSKSYEISKIDSDIQFTGLDPQDFIKAYTQKMACPGVVGRSQYDKIRSNARFGKCPYCGVGVVTTLDHYLPKAEYPLYSTLSDNLLPCCKFCNDNKKVKAASNDMKYTINPHFDLHDDFEWIEMVVIAQTPIGFKFQPKQQPTNNAIINSKIKFHFEHLRLWEVYIPEASSNFAAEEFMMRERFQSRGASGLLEYLEENQLSCEYGRGKGYWKTAYYKALSLSPFFVEEYFR